MYSTLSILLVLESSLLYICLVSFQGPCWALEKSFYISVLSRFNLQQAKNWHSLQNGHRQQYVKHATENGTLWLQRVLSLDLL